MVTKVYKKILEIEPSNKEAALGLVELYAVKQGDFQKALEFLDGLIEKNPDEAQYIFEKAKLLYKLGREDEALGLLEKVLQVDMMLVDGWILRAEIYEKEGNIDLAAESYEILTKVKPNDPNSWYLRAKFMAKIGKKKDAIKFLNRALKIDPEFKPALELKEKL